MKKTFIEPKIEICEINTEPVLNFGPVFLGDSGNIETEGGNASNPFHKGE